MNKQENRFKPKVLSKEDWFLVTLYAETNKPLDDLPYSPEFDTLHSVYQKIFGEITKSDLLKRLMRLRKSGRLTRLGNTLSNLLETNEEAVMSKLGDVLGKDICDTARRVLNDDGLNGETMSEEHLLRKALVRMTIDAAISKYPKDDNSEIDS